MGRFCWRGGGGKLSTWAGFVEGGGGGGELSVWSFIDPVLRVRARWTESCNLISSGRGRNFPILPAVNGTSQMQFVRRAKFQLRNFARIINFYRWHVQKLRNTTETFASLEIKSPQFQNTPTQSDTSHFGKKLSLLTRTTIGTQGKWKRQLL